MAVPVMLAAKRTAGRKGNKRSGKGRQGDGQAAQSTSASPAKQPEVLGHADGFLGPLAPTAEDDDDVETSAEHNDVERPFGDDLPVASEARIRLPDLPSSATSSGVLRRRRRRREDGENDADENREASNEGDTERERNEVSRRRDDARREEQTEEERTQAQVDAVRKLTEEYRKGDAAATEKLMREIEIDPDYLFQTGNATGEYDLTSALIGTGSPNKQGVYVLPYLQSGHVLMLLVVLLCAFVYYPGFPLTELDDEVRNVLKAGLALTYCVNAVLAVFAYRAAQARSQPPVFWAFKTLVLGGLAFQELRTNVPLDSEREALEQQRAARKPGRKYRTKK